MFKNFVAIRQSVFARERVPKQCKNLREATGKNMRRRTHQNSFKKVNKNNVYTIFK